MTAQTTQREPPESQQEPGTTARGNYSSNCKGNCKSNCKGNCKGNGKGNRGQGAVQCT